MTERIVVEFLLDNKWTFSRDFPLRDELEAEDHGRDLWRRGVAGVRISRFTRNVIQEHRR